MTEVDGQAAFTAAVLAAGGQVTGKPTAQPTPIPSPREPTADQLAEWEGRRLQQAHRWLTEKRALDVFTVALVSVTDPVARAVVDLHKDDSGICAAEQDWDGYGASWPCQTVVTVATTLGIPVPPHLVD